MPRRGSTLTTTRSRQVVVVTSEHLQFLASCYSDTNWEVTDTSFFFEVLGHVHTNERVEQAGQLIKKCNGLPYFL